MPSILKASKSRMRIWQSWRSFATSSMVNGITESTRTTINSVQDIFSSHLGHHSCPEKYTEAVSFPLRHMAKQLRQTFIASQITHALPSVDHPAEETILPIMDHHQLPVVGFRSKGIVRSYVTREVHCRYAPYFKHRQSPMGLHSLKLYWCLTRSIVALSPCSITLLELSSRGISNTPK